MTQEEINALHPSKRIYVRAWWYKDRRAVLCEVKSVYCANKNKFRSSWEPVPDNVDDVTHVTVHPLEGNSHERFINAGDIIS